MNGFNMRELDAVFVYGTLKKGGPLHQALGDSRLVHITTTKEPKWQLRSTGSYPAMGKGQGYVSGQVYEVDESVLQHLDWVEGVPNLYKRERVDMVNWPSPVWAYVFNQDLPNDPDAANKTYSWSLLDNAVVVV